MIKILIADDQELIRQSPWIVLSSRPDIMVTDVVSSRQEVIRSVRKGKPDVILMGIRIPKLDDVQHTKVVKKNYPQIEIIIPTTFDGDKYVYNALKYSANRYLLKGVSMDKLASAITTVHNRRAMINPDIITKVLRLSSQMAQAGYAILVNGENMDELIKTGWKIIAQVEEGASDREIVEIPKLSEGTVRNYLSTILNKLDLRDCAQLAIQAVQTNTRKRLGT